MVTAIKGNDTSTFGGQVVIPSPAFSVYASASNTVSATVYTKVQLNTEKFDLTNDFDNATNYRFTPSVEGYYQINTKVRATSSTNSLDLVIVAVYKNGSAYESVQYNPDNSYSEECAFSTLVYLNGSTDYIELYSSIYGSGTLSQNSVNSALSSSMSGYLVRAV